MFDIPFLDIPPLGFANGRVLLPGSKSISNRVLLLSAMCVGTTRLHDLLDSDDTRVMLDALRTLGCGVRIDGNVVEIDGLGGQIQVDHASLFMGNAGTAMRPLTAVLALLGGEFSLSGVARMHERPIGDLVDALLQLGCNIEYLGQAGYPPLKIGKPSLQLAEPIKVRGDVSSQFLTALLLALPLVAKADIVITVVGELISKPYIEITLNLLARFGVTVTRDGWQSFSIPAHSRLVSPGDLYVEADASSASYFIALGAIAAQRGYGDKTSVTIEGVGLQSIQGDIRFVEAACMMGAVVEGGPNWLKVSRGKWPLIGIDLDCNHIPDAAMTLAVMALYAKGKTVLRNIASWRVKETDRIAAMCTELRKFGATVEEGPDFLAISPPLGASGWKAASVHTYDDHRIAMCFALAAFNPARLPVRILDPKCVAKTFPEYFETLFSAVHPRLKDVPVLCIDGPTASGKGTVAAAVALQLGFQFLDSGSLYRIAGLVASSAGHTIEPANESKIVELLRLVKIEFKGGQVVLNNVDVSDTIRTEAAGINASKVSALHAVRSALIHVQHEFQRLPGLVADGRDMGTVIFPQAQLKIYLSASVEKRAQRRYKQLISKGISTTLPSLRADLEARDARDSSRDVAPLKPAADALLLDNSELTVEETVNQVLVWWQSKQPFGSV